MEQIIETLKNIGLNENETNIYIELLKLGSAPASIIGKNIGLPRTTTKFTCEQLLTKKVIQGVQKGNKVIYSIETPENLLHLLKKQQETIEENRTSLNNLMGKMKSLLNPEAVLPKIQFFEGEDGLIKTFEDILNHIEKDDQIYSFTKLYKSLDAFPKLERAIRKYTTEREKKHVMEKVIQVSSTHNEKKIPFNPKYRTIKTLESAPVEFDGAQMYIYKKTTWHISIKDNIIFGYKVENDIFAQMYKMLFDFVWKNT